MICIAICDDDVKGAETAGRIVERCCREKEIACKSRIFYDSKALTSYEQYVYKSFQVQSYQFIPKKNAGEMLPAAVRDALRLAVDREGKYYVAENQRVLEKKIPLKSITYIWHREKYAYIEKSNKEHTKVRKTLKQVYKALPEEEFVWVDRGVL